MLKQASAKKILPARQKNGKFSPNSKLATCRKATRKMQLPAARNHSRKITNAGQSTEPTLETETAQVIPGKVSVRETHKKPSDEHERRGMSDELAGA